MQFSTSTALAAILSCLFAGQSLADNVCESGLPTPPPDMELSSNIHGCKPLAGPNSWDCPHSGTVVSRGSGTASSQWIVHTGAGASGLGLGVSCSPDLHVMLRCPAETWTSFTLDCPPNLPMTIDDYDFTFFGRLSPP